MSSRFILRRWVSLRIVLVVQPDGPEIRRRRELRGYGLRTFALAAEISHTHLSRIEREIKGAQPEVMARIAELLDCGIRDIERDRTEPNDERDEDRLALHDHEGTRRRAADDA
ncbi:helix-turn-helix transcriptional regulator [Streptomyces sp. NPDC006267]|uniref:helix-turn-helix domain-containing protein n=1 Tax=Streptomyces sp. NPDC006267 TaxID=3157173 RepID=UPI0033B6A348